jgi:hypothetical protein
MGKYEPLGVFLRSQKQARISMTFAQIERILKAKLPMSKKQRAWWSNNPDNNVMTREWLDAGFETEAVDVVSEKLVFRKHAPVLSKRKRHPIFGCMKGLFTLAEGYDPTAPLDLEDDWDSKYIGPNLPE